MKKSTQPFATLICFAARLQRRQLCKLTLVGFLALTMHPASTHAYTTRTKANNNTALGNTGAWVGSTLPTSSDVTIWDTTLNTVFNAAGVATTWYGIEVRDIRKTVKVGSTGTLILTPTSGDHAGILGTTAWTANSFEWNQSVQLGINQGWTNLSVLSIAVSRAINLNGKTLTIGGAGNFSLNCANGVISGASSTIDKYDSGKLTLGGATTPNTYSGDVNLRDGVILLNEATALGTCVFHINPGNVNPTTAQLNCSAASPVTLTGNNVRWEGDFTFVGNQSLSFGIESVALVNGNRTVTVNTAVAGTTLTVNGVISEITAGSKLTKAGTGKLILGGQNTFTGGFTLSAGQVTFINARTQPIGTAAGTFTISGGIIDCGATVTTVNYPQAWNGDFTYVGSTAADLNLGTGGVTLAGDRQVTVSAAKLTVGGVITDSTSSFSLTKAGSGTLTLDGINTYDGGTTVSAGRLQVNGNSGTGTGSVAVNAGGTLGGSGTVAGDVTVDNDSTAVLYPNSGSALTLVGNLTLSGASSKLKFDLTTTVAGANDKVVMNGSSKTLSITTGNPVIDINCASTTDLEAANYTLIDLSGNTISGSGSFNPVVNWVGSTPGNSASFTVETVGGNIVLKYTAPSGKTQPIRWATISGNWDTTTANWLDSAATPVAQMYADGDQVQLEDTQSGASPITITLNSPPVAPLSFLVNATKDYTISGSGAIAGLTGLTKSGAGTLTLGVASTYTGVNTLNAGTVNLGVAESVGTSGPLGNSAAANAGNIVLAGATLQYSGVNQNDYSGRFSTTASQAYRVDTAAQAVSWGTGLSSSGGTLTKSGSGTLTLSAANSYTGDTRIVDGSLTLAHANALQSSTLDMNSADSGRLDFDSLSGTVNVGNLTGTRNLDVASGVTLSIGGNNLSKAYTGTISGSGGFSKTGTGVFTLGDSSGPTHTYNGNTTVSQGTVVISKSDVLPYGGGNGNLNVVGILTMAQTGTDLNLHVNGLSGTGTITTSGFSGTAPGPTITMGENGDSSIWGGKILKSTGSANQHNSFVKLGTGTLTMSNANAIGGTAGCGFFLNAGRVIVNNGATGGCGSYGITVNDPTGAGSATLEIVGMALDPLNGGGMTLGTNATLMGSGGTSFWTRSSSITGDGPTILNYAQVTLSTATAGDTLTLGSVVSGGNADSLITVSGDGIVKFNGNNTYAGKITVSAGTLELALTTGKINSSTTVNVSGGTLLLSGGNDKLADTATVTISGGTGTLVIDANSDTVATVVLTDGSITGSGGTLTATSNFDVRKGSVSAKLGGTGVGLTKTTTSTVTLSGVNAYSGNTTVSDGTLALAGSGSIVSSPNITVASGATFDVGGVTSPPYSLASGQTLKGGGNVHGKLTVAGDAFLSPGTSIGTLTCDDDLTLSGTTSMEINKTLFPSQTADKIVMSSGTVTLGGNLTVVSLAGTLAKDDTFDLIDGTIAGSGFASYTLPNPGTGLTWDTTQLSAGGNGTIKVVCDGSLACSITGDSSVLPSTTGHSYSAPSMSTYAWSITSGNGVNGSINGSSSSQTVTVDSLAAGSFDLHLAITDANGCSSTCDKTVTVATPTVVYVDDDYTSGSSGGHTWGADAFATVQAGVGAVAAGGTVNVAVGTYAEIGQIVIGKNLSIVGADKITTIIKTDQDTGSADDDNRGWFVVGAGFTFNLQGVTMDGTGHKIYQAVRHQGAGTISDCVFTNIQYEASGPAYQGTAVAVHSSGQVDVTGCSFRDIGRNGVAAYDVYDPLPATGPTGTYSGNDYVGKGTGNWLDYAFLIQGGADVTIHNNQISQCVGVATVDGSDSGGIAVWDDPGTKATVTGNTLTDNTSGLAIAIWYGGTADPQVDIGAGNTFTGGSIGVDIQNVSGVSAAAPAVTFGASTFKGQSSQAIRLQSSMSAGTVHNIGSVIFKDSGDTVITDNFAKEDLVYHVIDAADRGLLIWNAGNVYVTPNSGGIQAAVNAAPVGGTVNVAAGTYAGNITINKALTLVGDPGDVSAGPGPSAPVIYGGSLPGSAFFIANGVSDVTIRGFEMRNFTSPDMDGIGNGVSAWVGSTARITIQDNYFHDLGYNGVLVGNDDALGDHSNWTIKANIIETFGYIGFELTNTKDSSIEDNVIHMMTPDIGAIFISARRSESGLTIKNNRIDGTPSTVFPVVYIYAYDVDMVSPTLNNVLIEGNDIASVGTPFQIYIRDIGTGRITGVQVRNNSLSTLRNRTAATVDATSNWWGTIDGATIATHITGLVAGDVDYSPWLGDGTDTQPTVVGFQPNAAPIYYTPTGLSFSTQPGGALAASSLSPQPVVMVTNEVGAVALQYTSLVSLAIGSNPGGGTLSGTSPVAAVNGVATFSGLAIDKGGVGYTLLAAATGLSSVTSDAFTIGNPAPVLTSISPAWKAVGGAGFTLTVTGSGFAPSSVVQWGGAARVTTYVSATELTAAILAADIVSAGTTNVTVNTPTPGGGTTAPQTFTIYGTPAVVYVDDNYTPGGGNDGHLWGYDAFATINAAVTAVETAGTVNVAVGTYAENLTIPKSLHLIGAGAGTILYPAVSDVGTDPDAGPSFRGSQMIVVTANDVEIASLTLDGDNPSLTSGVIRSGADIDARNGIIQGDPGPFTGLVVHDCIVKNIYLRAIYARSPGSPNGFSFYRNTVSNVIGGYSSYGLGAFGGSGSYVSNIVVNASGLMGNNCASVTISDNLVTNCVGGIHLDNSTAASVIMRNVVVDGGEYSWGVWAFNPQASFIISENRVINCDGGVVAVAGNNNLITIKNNELDGGTVRINTQGIIVTDALSWWGYGDSPCTAAVRSNSVKNFETGVYIYRASTPVSASGFGNSISGGLYCDNTGSTLYDFSGNWWGVTTPAGVAAQIVGNVDYTPWLNAGTDTSANAGFQGDFSVLDVAAASPQTGATGRIQEGVNLVSGSTVNVAAGLYAERLIISKAITLLGATAGVSKKSFAVPGGYAYDPIVESIIKPATDAQVPVIDVEKSGGGDIAGHITIKGFVITDQGAVDNNANRGLINLNIFTGLPDGILIENNVLGPHTGPAQNGLKGRGGISSEGPSNVSRKNMVIKDNLIFDNLGDGVGIMLVGAYIYKGSSQDFSGSRIENNTISGNTRSGIEIAGGVNGLVADPFVIANNTIKDSGWRIDYGIASYASKLKYGNGITFIRGGGETDSQNNQTPVVPLVPLFPFSSPTYVSITGNEITHNEKNGIYLGPMPQHISVTGNTIQGNGTGGGSYLTWDGIRLDLEENYYGVPGSRLYSLPLVLDKFSDNVFNSNSIAGNGNAGVNVIGTPTLGPVDAESNWWGNAKGPTIASNPGGNGDAVSANVDFSPWFGGGPNLTPLYYTPTGLSFSTQPGGAAAGSPLLPQPVVTVTNEIGGVALQFQGSVSVAIGSNPSGGTLSGTTPVAAVNGVATFSGFAINKAGAGYTLVATATALSSATSAAFDITNPLPVLSGINPTWKLAGGAGFTLTVDGANFKADSVVRWGGSPRSTTYVSDTQLTAAILATDISAEGNVNVSVFTPAPGGGETTTRTFQVKALVPTVVYVDDGYVGQPANTLVNFPYTGAGTNIIGYDAFATVQAAVTAVAASGTVNVAAGTYIEHGQILIAKDVTILGAGAALTTIKPDGDFLTGGWMLVDNAISLTMRGVTLSGQGHNIRNGLRNRGNLTLTDCVLSDFAAPSYQGFAVCSDWEAAGAMTMSITRCRFTNFGRVGVQVDEGFYGASVATIADCTFVGKGPGDHLDYAITVEGGASATVTGNDISACRGVALSDGSTSAGISATTYFAPGTEFTASSNTVHDCSYAIAVGYDSTDTTSGTIYSNDLSGNGYGVAVSSATCSVDATLNWWGSARGPTFASNPGGNGDAVSANMDFSPWLGDGTDMSSNPGFQPNATPIYYTPAGLSFSIQPGGNAAGCSLTPQPVVTVTNEIGGVALQYQGAVTVAIANNPGSATLSGTPTQSAVNGVATFSGLAINKAGVGYTLAASAAGLGSATSDAFTVTITLIPDSPLPDGQKGSSYSATISTSGCTPPYNFAVTSGTLPPGLSLASGGLLSGTASSIGFFVFTVAATNDSGCRSDKIYSLTILPDVPDIFKPTLVITSPAYNARVFATPTNITGTAMDRPLATASGVYQVYFGLNGAPVTNLAYGTTNWSASAALVPGTNTFVVKSRDLAGNESLPTTRKYFYVVTNDLKILAINSGTVSFNAAPLVTPAIVSLEINRDYSLTAMAGANYVFRNWLSSTNVGTTNVATTSTRITFNMKSNLVFVAIFETNRFIAAAGSYYGLFSDEITPMVSFERSGLFTLKANSKQKFSGKLYLDGNVVGYAGTLNLDGYGVSKPAVRKGKAALQVTVQMTFDGSDSVSGEVVALSNAPSPYVLYPAAFTSALTGFKAGFNATDTLATNLLGYYTLVVDVPADPLSPKGNGFGMVKVRPQGLPSLPWVTKVGYLGDFASFKPVTVPISQNGDWPMYARTYKGTLPYQDKYGNWKVNTEYKGMLMGWMKFTNHTGLPAGRDLLDSSVHWIKLPNTNNFYPVGFTNHDLAVFASAYNAPANPKSVRVLDLTNGSMVFVDGDLTTMMSNHFFLNTNSVIRIDPPNVNGQTMAISPTVGSLWGKFYYPNDPLNSVRIPRGVVLQDENIARGVFKGTNSTGSFLLQGD